MKRDMEIIRDVLIALEKSEEFEPSPEYVYEALGAKNNFPKMRLVMWHLQLMVQADLIEMKTRAFDFGSEDDVTVSSVRILWKGYDFLAEASNPQIWEAAKRRAGDAFYSLSIGTLQALLSAAARQVVGL